MVLRRIIFTFLFSGLFILGWSNPARATITIVDVQGESNFDGDASVPVIFGGVAGSACDGGTDTCNNCSDTLAACNTRRITDNTELTISIRSDAIDSGGRVLLVEDTGSDQSLIAKGTTVSGKDQTGSVTVTWFKLCQDLISDGDNSTCDGKSFTGDTRIGFDLNNDDDLEDEGEDEVEIKIKVHTPASDSSADTIDCTTTDQPGICSFTAFPGDEKIYIIDMQTGGGFPLTAGIYVDKLAFMYSVDGFDNANPGAIEVGDYRMLDVDPEGSEGAIVGYTERDYIDEFTNETTYYVRVATIDEANNLAYITSNETISEFCNNDSGYTSTPADANCPFVVTPSEVVGLLGQDVNCFVTTAAYGSSMAGKVQTFREFRNRILLSHKWGQELVKFYYRVGPKLSRFIVDNESYRAGARLLLWPAWLFAWLSLKIGWLWATLIFASVFLSPLVLWGFFRPQRSQQLEG